MQTTVHGQETTRPNKQEKFMNMSNTQKTLQNNKQKMP